MAAGKWFITPHAVQRYIERVRRCSYEEALEDLIRFSREAHPVREIRDGLWLYRKGRPNRLRFRVQIGGPGLPQLVTVLPECEHGRRDRRRQ